METNFDEIINDLRDAGYSDAHIAKMCGCTRQYIYKIRREGVGEVGFRVGARLVKLHEAIQ